MEKLKDIKDIVDVVDYSLYYLVGSLLLFLVCLVCLLYYFKKPKRRKKLTSKEIALKHLMSIDYEDEKSMAYIFTLNIDEFINQDNKEKIDSVLNRLEEYKYKKDISKASNDLKQDIKEIIEEIK
jgi:hypothetical protein